MSRVGEPGTPGLLFKYACPVCLCCTTLDYEPDDGSLSCRICGYTNDEYEFRIVEKESKEMVKDSKLLCREHVIDNTVKVTLKMPFPVDRPNINGITFSSKCLEELKKSVIGRAIVTKDGAVVGQITEVGEYDGEYFICQGELFMHGLVTEVPSFTNIERPIESVTFREYVIGKEDYGR